MYNLIEYSGAYSKPLESLWQYYRDEPALNANNEIIDFAADNNNRASLAGQRGYGGTRNVEIMV